MKHAWKHASRLRKDGRDAPRPRATDAESLDYLSDMIEQLHALAERAGYPALAGLLGRALAEATVQRERG